MLRLHELVFHSPYFKDRNVKDVIINSYFDICVAERSVMCYLTAL